MGTQKVRYVCGVIPALFATVVIGLFLRVHAVNQVDIWDLPRYSSSDLCAGSGFFGDLIFFGSGVEQGPVQYILLQIATIISRHECIVTLPSLIFSLASIVLVYKLGVRLFGVLVGQVTALLLAISLWDIVYAVDIKNVPLYSFCCLCMVYWFIRAMQADSLRNWAGFVVASIICFYTNFPIMIVLGGMVVWFVLFQGKLKEGGQVDEVREGLRRRKRIHLGFSLIAIIVCIAPMLTAVIQAVMDTSSVRVLLLDRDGLTLASYTRVLLEVFSGGRFYVPVAVLFGLAGIVSWAKGLSCHVYSLLLATIIVCVLLSYAVCVSLSMRVVPRYVHCLLPLFYLLVARGLIGLHRRAGIIIGFCLVNVAFGCFLLGGFHWGNVFPHEFRKVSVGYRAVADFLRIFGRDGDVVLCTDLPLLHYYLNKSNAEPLHFAYLEGSSYYYYSQDKTPRIRFHEPEGRLINIAQLKKLILESKRLWIMVYGGPEYTYWDVPWLAKWMLLHVPAITQLGEVQILLLTREMFFQNGPLVVDACTRCFSTIDFDEVFLCGPDQELDFEPILYPFDRRRQWLKRLLVD